LTCAITRQRPPFVIDTDVLYGRIRRIREVRCALLDEHLIEPGERLEASARNGARDDLSRVVHEVHAERGASRASLCEHRVDH
jgi:hypothetical protein